MPYLQTPPIFEIEDYSPNIWTFGEHVKGPVQGWQLPPLLEVSLICHLMIYAIEQTQVCSNTWRQQ